MHDRIRLASARHMVSSDPSVLNGAPVVGETRAPVFEVASLLRRSSVAEVLGAYPMLTAHQVELCGVYADAYDRRLLGPPPAI